MHILYLDPGFGSTVFQFFIAGLATLGLLIRPLIVKLRSLRKKKKQRDDEDDE